MSFGAARGSLALVVGMATVVALLLLGPGEKRASQVEKTFRASSTTTGVPPIELPVDRGSFAADFDLAQTIIEDPAATPDDLARAGAYEQLAIAALHRAPASARVAILALLGRQAAAGVRRDLDAAAALSRLNGPGRRPPRWRISQPPPPSVLLGYFTAAQARFGIRWQYLAAIELVETKFGRIHGVSSAGAQGPMQFLPSTWARYGRGNIEDPRDAIFGAARYLRASGAPADIGRALYHYNPSLDYVRAVKDYATRMISDPRAYLGYYGWQVLYSTRRATLLLPVGYPKVPPARVGFPSLR